MREQRGALPRTAPVFRIIRDAAGIEPEAATLDRDRAAQRLRNYKSAARRLDQHGALRDGLTIDQAAAAIFTIGHPETYRTLVLDGNWDDRRWATWAQATLETALDARIAEEAGASSLAWFALFAVLLLAFNLASVLMFSPAGQPRVRVPFSPYFVSQVQAGRVASIRSTGDAIEGTFKSSVRYPTGDTKATPTTLFATEVPAFWNKRSVDRTAAGARGPDQRPVHDTGHAAARLAPLGLRSNAVDRGGDHPAHAPGCHPPKRSLCSPRPTGPRSSTRHSYAQADSTVASPCSHRTGSVVGRFSRCTRAS